MATTKKQTVMKATRPSTPDLQTEVANRLRDPFENLFNGLIRTNDPLLLERGDAGNYALYKDLKRDGKVYSGLQKRVLALISRPYKVDPIEDGPQGRKDAEIVQAMLKRLAFDKVCSDLMEALLLGFVPAEIVWVERDNLIAAKRIVKRAQRRFVYVQTDPNASPELRLLTAQNMQTGERLPERKFIVHRFNPEDDNPYGTGLGLQLYWPVFFKRKGIIAWNKLNDRFGSPTPWGKHPNGASPKEKGTLFEALKAMSNDGVLMTPAGIDIELLESKLTGSISTQRELCEYMDAWISEVILSQEATQKTGATGAAANEREDVRLDLVQADADLLSDTLNSTLIEWICELNGLSPCMVSRIIKKPEDLLAASETDVNIASLGFKPSLEYIRERYGDGWEEAAPPAPSPAPATAAIAPPGAAAAQALPPPAPRPNESAAKPAASFAEPGLVAEDLDAIDDLVDAELANWQPLIVPAQDALQQAIDQSIAAGESASQLIARLPELLESMPVDALAQSLTRAAFTARLAAQAGIQSK